MEQEKLFHSLQLYREDLLSTERRNGLNFKVTIRFYSLARCLHPSGSIKSLVPPIPSICITFRAYSKVEAFSLFSFDLGTEFFRTLTDKIAGQLASCAECIPTFHAGQIAYFDLMGQCTAPLIMTEFKTKMNQWNVNRQILSMRGFLYRFSQTSDILAVKAIRLEAIFLIFEILTYPETLKSKTLDTLFCNFLEASQKRNKFKLKQSDFLYPGIIILLANHSLSVRDWARYCLNSTDLKLQESQIDVIAPIIKLICAAINEKNKGLSIIDLDDDANLEPIYHIVQTETELWDSLITILNAIPLNWYSIQLIFLSLPAFLGTTIFQADELVVTSFSNGVTFLFWERIDFLNTLLQHPDTCKWVSHNLTPTLARKLFRSIKESNEFQLMCRSTGGNDMKRTEQSFGWIVNLLNVIGADDWIREEILQLQKESFGWTSGFRATFQAMLISTKSPKFVDASEFSLLALLSGPVTFMSPVVKKWCFEVARQTFVTDIRKVANHDLKSKDLSIHYKIWDQFTLLADSFTDLLPSLIPEFLSLSFVGPLELDEKAGFNKASNTMINLFSLSIPKHINRLALDWKSQLNLMLFNNQIIRDCAIEYLLSSTQSINIKASFSKLIYLHQRSVADVLFSHFSSFKNKLSKGHSIKFSSEVLVDIFSALASIYFEDPKYRKEGSLIQNLWVHFSIVCHRILNYAKTWVYELSSLRPLLRKIFAEMKSYFGYRSIALSNVSQSNLDPLYADWGSETIISSKTWLIDNVEINYLSSQLAIDAFKILVDERCIVIDDAWRKKVNFDVSLVTNASQKEVLEKYLGLKKRVLPDVSVIYPSKKLVPLPYRAEDLSLSNASSTPIAYYSHTSRNHYESESDKIEIRTENSVHSKGQFDTSRPQFGMKQPAPFIPPRYISIPLRKNTVPVKGMSLMQKLKNDQTIQTKTNLLHNHPPNPLRHVLPIARPEPEIEEEEDEVRESRSVKRLHIPEIRPNGIKIAIPTTTRVKAGSLVNISKLFDLVLSWDLNDMESYSQVNFKTIKSSFQNGKEYVDSFEPLFFEEIKAQYKQASSDYQSRKSFTLLLDSTKTVDSRHEIILLMQLEDYKMENWGENGFLVIVSEDDKCHVIVVRIQEVKRKRSEVSLICQMNFKGNRSMIATRFRLKSQWMARAFFNLTTQVREYQALGRLNSLSLFQTILNPPRFTQTVSSQMKVDSFVKNLGVNQPQAQAIARAIQDTGFILIQGPPGTGKTKTILGLCAAIQNTGSSIALPTNPGQARFDGARRVGSKKRLMVCAPSNAAIDEICRRMMFGILSATGLKYKPKIVRIGKSSSIHEDIIPICLDTLIEKELADDPKFANITEENSSAAQMKDWIAEKEGLRARELEEKDRNSDFSREIGVLTAKIKEAKQREIDHNQSIRDSFDRAKTKARNRLILDADIIGAGHDTFNDIHGLEFETVIIDEACQAVELSTLIPLRYGCRKCILVGDPSQLPPTVISKVAAKYGFDQSIFQRFLKASPQSVSLLSIQCIASRIFILDRMHPAISLFPSQQFYQGRLRDASTMSESRNIEWQSKFSSFVFYNLQDGSEMRNRGQSLYNMEEVAASVRIVRHLGESFPHINFGNRIGIIAFYKEQVFRLKKAFVQEFGKSILSFIDINTVDGFQGQEKDIIILSCVRSSSKGGVGFLADGRRINVALTRARYTLIVLGDQRTLAGDFVWDSLLKSASSRGMNKNLNLRRELIVGKEHLNNLFLADVSAASSSATNRSAE